MCIERIISFIGSDCFANIISLFSLIMTLIVLVVGNKKVSEALLEYQRKKYLAVFSYHINMNVFIKRLKNLISNNQCKPMKTLFLFSSKEEIRKQGLGYEKMAERLADLSQKILDYLSTKPNQIPASITDKETNEWENLIEELINHLSGFLLYSTDSYLPKLDSIAEIKDYHSCLMEVLNKMAKLIDKAKKELAPNK